MTPLRRFLLAAAVSSAAVLAVFGRSLPHGFLYDDLWTIVRNPALPVAPWTAFFMDASTAAAPESGMGRTLYRPLPTMSFAANLRLAGPRPWAWRGPDLLLHGLCGALVFALLELFGLSAAGAAVGAALFLFHPVQVETVVWVTQRSNLMCAAAGLAALLLLAKGNAAGIPLYAAALLSKETAATLLPFLLLATAAAPGERGRKVRKAAELLLVTAFFLVLRKTVVGDFAQRARPGTLAQSLLVGQASWGEYVKLLAAPFRLSASHQAVVDDPFAHPAPWIGAAFFLLWIGAAVLLWRRNRKRAALALAWIPVTLSPHLGTLSLDTFVAERFLYLPTAGLAALAALAFDELAKRNRRAAAGGAALLLLLAAALSFRRTADWRDDLALWRSAVRVEPGNAFARLCLSEAFYARGRLGESAQAAREALTLNPSAPLAFAGLNNLSGLALREGRPGAAFRFAEKALRVRPDAPQALYNRGAARAALQKKSPAGFPPRALVGK